MVAIRVLRRQAIYRTLLLCAVGAAACASQRELTVVTLNMEKVPSVPTITAELRSISDLRGADLYLLQEVARGVAAPVAAALGLHTAEAPESPDAPNVELAILSRYPLRDVRLRTLGRYSLVFHSRLRYALSATAETPWGAIRIIDTHLDTRINISDRLAQLDGALAEIPAGPTVIGGDFNSNPFFWIDHVVPLLALPSQAVRVEQHMAARGFQSAIPRAVTTFDYLGMHLDWIWLRGGRSGGWRVYPLAFSDHHACWTRIAF